MAGYLGTDFVASVPADIDPAYQGAGLIRDIKERLKTFMDVTFDLETGVIKNGVIVGSMLENSGVTPGDYFQVSVDVFGRVTAGTNPTTLAGFGITDALPVAGVTSTDGSITITPGVNTVDLSIASASGTPFFYTATLNSASAGTAVIVIPDIAVPAGKACYVMGFIAQVTAGVSWTGMSAVTIQDNNGSPVPFATIPVASITGNTTILPSSTNVVLENAMGLGQGGTVGKGIQIIADSNASAGSPLVVTIFGVIK